MTYRLLPLSQGMFAMVDHRDYDHLSRWKWSYQRDGDDKGYAVRSERVEGKTVKVYMHREIVKPPGKLIVDHADGDGLNNRRYNLRAATRKQNSANTVSTNLAGFRGVFRRKGGTHYARITVDYKSVYLGTYETAAEAGRAYDLAALEQFGPFAWLNFDRSEYPHLTAHFDTPARVQALQDIPFFD